MEYFFWHAVLTPGKGVVSGGGGSARRGLAAPLELAYKQHLYFVFFLTRHPAKWSFTAKGGVDGKRGECH